MTQIKRALISVSDKTAIVEFVKTLVALDIEIISTGGTAKLLQQNQIPVVEISDYTQFPEMMSGRLKTLHPKIHGGLLGRRGTDDDVMVQHDIKPIDLVVVNLYPFESTVAKPDCTLQDAIENIDIGGPTMLRAAAKNYQDVTVVVDVNDYQQVTQALQKDHQISEKTRFDLAVKVFEHTAKYDAAIANYLGKLTQPKDSFFPRTWNQQFHLTETMRYGENPHQQAAFYKEINAPDASIATAKQQQGKALSFNNVADTDAALECVKSFDQAACVIVKHANPCGVAIADNIQTAYEKAYATDPTSAFGGIIAFNQPLDGATAEMIINRQFVEVIIAPSVTVEARALLTQKANIRVLESGVWESASTEGIDFKKVTGGLLIQQRDLGVIQKQDLQVVTQRTPSDEELDDLLFSWKVVKFVKSNAIVYCKQGQTIGIGAGQMSRVYSARIAIIKAQDVDLKVAGSVMASDAFFPFRDGIDSAAEAGVRAIIQPGGSKRDQEVIDAANQHNMTMVFTGMRHFRH